MDVAERRALAALCHHGFRQHRLVREGNANPNMLVRFDPATEKFQTWPILPSGGGVVRHMVVGPDGSLWLADSEVDAITKVEIKAATGTR